MTTALVVATLSRDEARSLTDEVKVDADRLWRKLVELYDGAAHIALGYSSWGGYFEAEFGGKKSQAYRVLDAGRVAAALHSPNGERPPLNEAQARELAPLLDEPARMQDAWAEASADGDPTALKVREAVERRTHTTAILNSSESDEWYTPAAYVEAARDFLGGIDLDPASCEQANETIRATRFFTESDDGLAREWHGRVFLNPPYGFRCPLFVAKLEAECAAGRVTEALLLVNAYSTETRWFQPLFARPICFVDHRIKFYSPSGRGGSPTYGSAFVYFGPREAEFVRAFRQLGAVAQEAA